MSILSWSDWLSQKDKLRLHDIQKILDSTQLSASGILTLPDGWGGTERYDVALALYAQIPEYQEQQRILDLRWQPLSQLPIAGFSALEEVYLHENKLHEIPVSIAQLRRLRVLSLGRNHITTLPRELATMWLALRRLILGDNQITDLPFTEDEMLIEQGSIGSNPLKEPVGSRWMTRASVLDAVEKIQTLLTPIPGCSKDIAGIQIERGIGLCKHLAEPMIYEQLFAGYTYKEGVLAHPSRRNVWEQGALKVLRKCLPLDVMLAPSFFDR